MSSGPRHRPFFLASVSRRCDTDCLCRFILGLDRTFFLHFYAAINGKASYNRAMLRYVLYFDQHLLQADCAEHTIDATITAQVMTLSDSHHHEPKWVSWSNENLMNLPLSQLSVTLDGAFRSAQIQQLYAELETRQLLFRPHCWLSHEWCTPEGVPGIAVPFYLAHPRLAQLEMGQMLEVEGGIPEGCMRTLRHEAGHAVKNAYRLRCLRSRQQVFGRSSNPYQKYYSPRPYGLSSVRHLGVWYAQSHPDEDFAETFAVWLTPDSAWADRYQGWSVLKQLQYGDGLMEGLSAVPPKVVTSEESDPLHELKKTLREHYERKRMHYGVERPSLYDPDLKRLFSHAPADADYMSAATFLSRFRKEVRRKVAAWIGEYQYTIDQVLARIIHEGSWRKRADAMRDGHAEP